MNTMNTSIKKTIVIERVSRDGRIKNYTNKSSRDLSNRQDAPYILFQVTVFL